MPKWEYLIVGVGGKVIKGYKGGYSTEDDYYEGTPIVRITIVDSSGRHDEFEQKNMPSDHDIINAYGDANWELLSVKLFKEVNSRQYYFKRQK